MKKDKKLYVASFCGLGLTVMSGVALSQVPEGVSAIDSVTKQATARVSVAAACTMGGTVDTAHVATVSPGNYTENIGTTTLNVSCNDPGGFAVYAVGFGKGVWGETKLINYDFSGYDIETGTAVNGDVSNWAMKVGAVSGTYTNTVVIEGGYGAYHAVPNDAEKVASFSATTNKTVTAGLTTTYAVYVTPAQAAGTYEGQVKYILVNPSNASSPVNVAE